MQVVEMSGRQAQVVINLEAGTQIQVCAPVVVGVDGVRHSGVAVLSAAAYSHERSENAELAKFVLEYDIRRMIPRVD